MNRKNPKRKITLQHTKEKINKLGKTKIIESAAKIAMKNSTVEQEANKLSKLDVATKNSLGKFFRHQVGMTQQQFLDKVTEKLQSMVADGLDDLHKSIEDIPPQNKAYALSVIFDKFLTVSGRPTNITASANVKLGASEMSPDQVRNILKGTKKEVGKQEPVATDAIIQDAEEELEEDAQSIEE